MMDIECIIFVRGKIPDEAIVELARERGIVMMQQSGACFAARGYSMPPLVGQAEDEMSSH
jgi:hypothetical protein